jgi:predicted phage tail protein
MQRVRLLGELGERFGAEHEFYNLRSPAEAIKLLCINDSAFTEYLVTSHEHGIGYQVIQAESELDYPDLQLPFGERDLTIVPVVMGSGGAVTKILVGVGLVVGAILLGPAVGGFLGLGLGLTSGATAGAIATAIGSIGVSLALGGIAQLISPQPALPTLGGDLRFNAGVTGGSTPSSSSGPTALNRGTSGKQSYAYTGAANTVGIGATIPVAYGEVLIGSHLLSAKIDVTDDSDPLATTVAPESFDNVRVDGEVLSYSFPASLVGSNTYRTRRATANDPEVGQFGDKRYILNQALGLNKGDKAENDFEVYNAGRDKFTVTYELPKGIRGRVGEAGTTVTYGYFTYKIELILVANPQQPQYVGKVYAGHQSTIQGLTPQSPYYWQSRFSLPQIPKGGQGGVWRLRTTIIDVDVSPSVNFRIKATSYGG